MAPLVDRSINTSLPLILTSRIACKCFDRMTGCSEFFGKWAKVLVRQRRRHDLCPSLGKHADDALTQPARCP